MNFASKRFGLIAAAAAGCVVIVGGMFNNAAVGGSPSINLISDRMGVKKAPEFVGGKNAWINSPPLKMSELRGKVVLIDFWEYTCINCLRTQPYLNEWNKRYAQYGLIIVGVHTPEYNFSREVKNVADAVKRLEITYPVLVDNQFDNWMAYDNQYWPRKYLIDKDGNIVYDHVGEGGYQATERRIQDELHKINPTLKFPEPMDSVRSIDMPGAVCYPTTPEVYTGYTRGELGNKDMQNDSPFIYKEAGKHVDGIPFLKGKFIFRRDSILHAQETNEPIDTLTMKYQAKEIQSVLKAEKGKSYRLYVKQDGADIKKEDKGTDIQYDDLGHSYVLVDVPRMYTLVTNEHHGVHEITLSSTSDQWAIYSFTFTSSCVDSSTLPLMNKK